jgi:hypothetical protein
VCIAKEIALTKPILRKKIYYYYRVAIAFSNTANTYDDDNVCNNDNYRVRSLVKVEQVENAYF